MLNPSTTRSINSALLYNIFNLFLLLRNLINVNYKALYISYSINRRSSDNIAALYAYIINKYIRNYYMLNKRLPQVEITPTLAFRGGAYILRIAPRWTLKLVT